MNNEWKHFKTIADSEYCEIDGVNIWDYKWISDYETIIVKDPLYGETKSFNHFCIELANNKIEFVAGEFSNCVWGIYTKTDYQNKNEINVSDRDAFNIIKEFIEKHFNENYDETEEYENCFHISIYSKENKESNLWFEYDIGNSELIVGYGISHTHYGKQYGIELSQGLNRLIDFFTTKIRNTHYYKGSVNFKTIYETKKGNDFYSVLGTNSMLFLYPFWKKTTKKVIEYSELVKDENVIEELEKMREKINIVC
jgi:hypothetical protein